MIVTRRNGIPPTTRLTTSRRARWWCRGGPTGGGAPPRRCEAGLLGGDRDPRRPVAKVATTSTRAPADPGANAAPAKGRNGMTEQGSLGVAVVGTGRMGADHVRRITDVISGAHVAAVVDLDTDRAKAIAAGIEGCAAYADPAVALAAPGVDAVLVASPGPAHEAALLTRLRARPARTLREAAHPGLGLRAARCWRPNSDWATAGCRWGSCAATTASTSSSSPCWTAASWAGRCCCTTGTATPRPRPASPTPWPSTTPSPTRWTSPAGCSARRSPPSPCCGPGRPRTPPRA